MTNEQLDIDVVKKYSPAILNVCVIRFDVAFLCGRKEMRKKS